MYKNKWRGKTRLTPFISTGARATCVECGLGVNILGIPKIMKTPKAPVYLKRVINPRGKAMSVIYIH